MDTNRLLAAEETASLDYTVFSVVIATLVIVLVVEVLRHQLDVAASGNPFFQTVLELMYRELTTLGIVEFFIYLMHKYHENFNYAMEVVFVDVHFMLFYTALFNAIQSVLVRLVTSRRTDKAWIQTEDIDIGHYVAIRKEFDRVENEWKMLQNINSSSSCNMINHDSTRSDEAEESNNNPSSTVWQSIHRLWKDWYMKLRYPRLYMRKRKLLIPVRFHELRHHFIEQNGLTPKFKVSQYLKRSLTSVLLDFVHISSAAWVMVMALGILLYYISGITLNLTANKYTVYELLVGALASGVGLFLVITMVLYAKMRKIVSKILVMKLTIEDKQTGRQNTFRGFSALQTKMKSIDQINLFWGGKPGIIIVLTQFMQFGYALGLAAIFTYWKQIGSTDFKEKLLVVLLIGYGIYLHFLADILPWFTVCTSLGQLVNKERLHETMAKMKLNEEVRRVEAAAEAAAIEKEISMRRRQVEEKLQAKKQQEEEMLKHREFTNSGSSQPQKHGRKKSLSGGVGFMRIFQDKGSMNSSDTSNPGHWKRRSLSDGVQLMSDLHLGRNDSFDAFHSSSKLSDAAAEQLFSANNDAVDGETRLFLTEQEERMQPKSDTGLFTTLPPPTSKTKNNYSVDRELNGTASTKVAREQRKHRRMKSKSEGVAFMRSSFDTAKFEALSELVNMPAEDLPPLEKPKKERSFRLKAISEGVSMMQLGPNSNDIPQATSFNDTDSSNGLPLSRHERKQRRKLMKCQSEGVATMRSSFGKTNARGTQCSHVGEIINRQQPKQLETMSELVNLPAKDLPQIPDIPKKRERKARLRAISDGVSMMISQHDSTDQKPSFNYLLNSLSAAAEPVTEDKKVSFTNEDNKTSMDNSIDNTSEESVGGESDIDDVPDIMRDDIIVVRKKMKIAKVTALNWWVEMLLCHQYHILSLLFGPMACCFWIAMRVEGFNMAEGVLIDYHNTFHLDLRTSFWVETAWYCMMFVERFVALVVFAKSSNSKEILSASMGLCNVVTCCALLMASEVKRCCHEDESMELLRLLAAESSSTYYASDGSIVAECSCSAFGSRMYGGLGLIEPFTFLMALGPIRYLVAGPIVRLFGAKTDDTHHTTGEQHGHHHGSDPDAVRNIWLTTIGLHGEVAKTHGLFSVEVLYCMLGLEVPEQKSQETNNDSILEVDSSVPFESTQASEKTSEFNSHQEVASPTVRNSLGIMFDEEEFSYPDSKLIRRMRRCERKMLPLLETWSLVDIVLTNHELVILEVPDDNDEVCSGNTCVALSDGGKGLRLADVVKGRKVVSTFLLDEIDFIDIEHSHRIASGEINERDVESNSQDLGEFWQGCTDALTYDPVDMSSRWCQVDEDRLKIHFTGGCGTLYLRILADLKEKEATIKPFEEDTSLLDVVGRETKIWCRTIARLCGVANLKMDLPHFGDATGDDELGDFVKVTERDSSGIKQHRRRITRLPSQRW